MEECVAVLNYNRISKYFLFLFWMISCSTTAFSASVEEGCLAFSKIAERIAIQRDQEHSETKIMTELIENLEISHSFAENMISSIFQDLRPLAPDAIQYVYNDFCLKRDGEFLIQSFEN